MNRSMFYSKTNLSSMRAHPTLNGRIPRVHSTSSQLFRRWALICSFIDNEPSPQTPRITDLDLSLWVPLLLRLAVSVKQHLDFVYRWLGIGLTSGKHATLIQEAFTSTSTTEFATEDSHVLSHPLDSDR
jgi:hypothetical protein